METRLGRRSAPLVRLVVLLAGLLLVAAPAAAQDGQRVGGLSADRVGGLSTDELGLEVAVGYGGHVVPGRWMPVAVTLSPTRLFAGDVGVVVETGNGRLVESRDVEVAAGSTKVFRFLAPPAHSLSVQVAADGEDRGLTVRPPLERPESFLVGVLGSEVPADPPAITSYPLEQRGTVVPVDPAFLERSSRALDQLSAVVVSPETLAGFDERSRGRIQAAVASGLDLVVVPTTDGALELGLPWVAATGSTSVPLERQGDRQSARVLDLGPLAWGLSPADLGWSDDDRPVAAAVNAGRGRVLVSGLPLGGGPFGGDGAFWGRLLQGTTATSGPGEIESFGRIGQAAGEGLRSDDVALPAVGLIAVALVLYLLLVGPVNGLLLARLGRRELAWVTIPALTVVFTAGAFVASAGAETSNGLSGRAAYWIDGEGTQLQAAALRAPRPGQHELVFEGDDWDLAPATWSPVPAIVDRAGGDTVLRVSLEAMQVGTATAFRDLEGAPPLSLDVDPTEAGARVTVTNTTTTAVDDVRVRAGTLVARHGRLEAGASATVELDRDELPVVRDWHDNFAGLRAGDGTVVAPRSLEALLRWVTVDGNPGVVWATGTAGSDLGLGVPSADGRRTDDQGTFLAVGVTPGVPGTDTHVWEVDRRLVTTGFGEAWRPGPLAVEGRLEAVLRFRLPNEGPVAELVPSLERGQLDGMFEGDLGHRDVFEECHTVEERDERGDLVVIEECSAEAVTEPMPAPPPGRPAPGGGVPGGAGATGLEIYDHDARSWVLVADAFDGGDTTTRFVSPLGEVYVRAAGELHPFDFSGRGIAAERRSA
jgi:hypothetical protein